MSNISNILLSNISSMNDNVHYYNACCSYSRNCKHPVNNRFVGNSMTSLTPSTNLSLSSWSSRCSGSHGKALAFLLVFQECVALHAARTPFTTDSDCFMTFSASGRGVLPAADKYRKVSEIRKQIKQIYYGLQIIFFKPISGEMQGFSTFGWKHKGDMFNSEILAPNWLQSFGLWDISSAVLTGDQVFHFSSREVVPKPWIRTHRWVSTWFLVGC